MLVSFIYNAVFYEYFMSKSETKIFNLNMSRLSIYIGTCILVLEMIPTFMFHTLFT